MCLVFLFFLFFEMTLEFIEVCVWPELERENTVRAFL